jgi:hypothetical protein
MADTLLLLRAAQTNDESGFNTFMETLRTRSLYGS